MAAELVGSAVLSSFLQVAFNRLASRETLHYFQRRGLNETLVRKLKIMLISINSVIDDAEYRQFSDSNVKAWLCELKDAMYDAEDVLDEVNHQVYKHKMKAEAETQTCVACKQVWKLFSASTSSFDRRIKSRVEEVLKSLEFLANRKNDLGLEQSRGVVVGSVTNLPTTSLVDEDGIFGRDKDQENIISKLLNDKHFFVIPIVGMGGLGKTTLAQIVYNDEMIKSEFDYKVWVCVSNDFDVLRLTKVIFKKIKGSNAGDKDDLDTLQNKLKDELSGKKFLIVLDDVWCEKFELWDALLLPFNHGAAQGRILVTSRNESVALAGRADSDDIYLPGLLSDEDGWELFKKYAFRNSCPQINSDLEEMGRRIVEKCKGLPLALKTIGSLMYGKSSWEEWNRILTSELWGISCENILPALMLSYHYLPSHLKRCFAYCSLFPKDYEFDKVELVQLWMAQDFLQASNRLSKPIEELGNEAFQELLSRSFFQKSSVYETHFVMHDIVNDLAILVSGESSFKQEVKDIPKKALHLSFLSPNLQELSQFKGLQDTEKLRSFLALHPLPCSYSGLGLGNIIFDQLCKCKYLRSLSWPINVGLTEIPDSIRNLIHLRYLDLYDCGIKRLPKSICLLYNLQTLKLASCEDLDELPTDLYKLKNLRYLDLRYTNLRKIPPNLGELKNLQVVLLDSFYVGKCSELNIKQLGELNLQGKLSIFELQNVVDAMDALKANLKEKRNLYKLTFQWNRYNNDDSQNERDVLEKLQPHPNLKKLSINNYNDKWFPDWLVDNTVLPNIVSLKLVSCKYCFALPSLGLLPSLKSLLIEELDGIETVGADFFGGNSCTVPFRSLEKLELVGMVKWEEWDCKTASRAFPCLKELYISNCPKLKGNLPRQFLSLEDLAIYNSPQLVGLELWAPKIQRLILRSCGNEAEFPLKQPHGSLREIKLDRSCGSLKTFALDLFPAIYELSFEECKNLEMISISEGHNHVRTSLTELRIEECPKEWDCTTASRAFSCLKVLSIRDCPKLKGNFPQQLPSLEDLVIEHSPLFVALVLWAPKIQRLILRNCGNEVEFPLKQPHDSLCVVKLERSCGSLKTFALDLFPAIYELSLGGCKNLEMISISEGHSHVLTNLTELKIEECPKFMSLPEPERINIFAPSLSRLYITDCSQMESFPEGGLPSKLTDLGIERCPKLFACRRKWGLHNHGSLRSLAIGDEVVGCLPELGLLPTSLTTLCIVGCSNLIMLDYNALCQAPSLKQLYLKDCPRLQCLPEEGLPSSLYLLQIMGDCSKLKQRCQKPIGQDWPKIAHISCVLIL